MENRGIQLRKKQRERERKSGVERKKERESERGNTN